MKKKCMLIIMDGFGLADASKHNAITTAQTPHLDHLFATKSWTRLQCSGNAVGLPKGQMGNSEVGHLNIGAGRILYQDITRINKSIEDHSFASNEALNHTLEHCHIHDSKLHIFGLLSNGGVHSSMTHLWEILRSAKSYGITKVYLHAFMDGRDTLPTSGKNFIQEFLNTSQKIGCGTLASISGRYYAMDRDNRWDRIEKAYAAIACGKGKTATNPIDCMRQNYNQKITDEFIIPTILTADNQPQAIVEDNDAILFFNFRADRARELTRSFVDPNFSHFSIKTLKNLYVATMTEYDHTLTPFVHLLFPPISLKNILGHVIEAEQKTQLRIAETEKYAHVTFFFNGGEERPCNGEDRILIPSPKVATYDLQPEMSAQEITEKATAAIMTSKYDLIVLNFANCDMVGHTGVFDAAVQAVETVDSCVEKITSALEEAHYSYIITADHGNAEKMQDEHHNIFTAHSTNPVPCIVSLPDKKPTLHDNGALADIAPTILKILNINQPAEMTGHSLF